MKVTDLSIWEQLGSIQRGWSELAVDCDASPLNFPSFCLPWWFEMGRGRPMTVAVEESGLLVGLALVHDRAGDVGRHMYRFIGDALGPYNQFLVADGRDDVTTVLLERLLSADWDLDLRSVPTEIAQGYQKAAPSALALIDQILPSFVSVPIGIERVQTSTSDEVFTVRTPAECIDLLTRAPQAEQWGGGPPGSQMAAFFESAVDASVRAGRMTLHVQMHHDGSFSGLLVAHGSRTSVVWRHVGRLGLTMDAMLEKSAIVEATARGSRRLVWPVSAGVSGDPLLLTDIARPPRKGGRLGEVHRTARSLIQGIRTYGSG